jgi:hypothetical protein
MNAVGAAIAAYASWQIDFMPFVVLEGTWSVVAFLALLRTWREPIENLRVGST